LTPPNRLVWVVSGACRGVGKTWLSTRLAAALPNAVYAKTGHGTPDACKSHNYFADVERFLEFESQLPADCEHCVVESNRLALRGDGDVRIFIAARPGMGDVRTDAGVLEADADIRIVPEADPKAWRRVVASKLASAGVGEGSLPRNTSRGVVEAVVALLEQQQQFITTRRQA